MIEIKELEIFFVFFCTIDIKTLMYGKLHFVQSWFLKRKWSKKGKKKTS